MGLLKIIRYGHPLLREKALDVKKIGAAERKLIDAMVQTMYVARGIGLAATQVGVMQRLFVVDPDPDREDEEDGEVEASSSLRIIVNPEIVWESEEDEPYKEGCLSVPGIEGEVYRPSRIRLVGRDERFEPVEFEADGLLARVIQHENDHLNGILFVDKLATLKRSLIAGQLNKIKRESQEELPNLSAHYPIAL